MWRKETEEYEECIVQAFINIPSSSSSFSSLSPAALCSSFYPSSTFSPSFWLLSVACFTSLGFVIFITYISKNDRRAWYEAIERRINSSRGGGGGTIMKRGKKSGHSIFQASSLTAAGATTAAVATASHGLLAVAQGNGAANGGELKGSGSFSKLPPQRRRGSTNASYNTNNRRISKSGAQLSSVHSVAPKSPSLAALTMMGGLSPMGLSLSRKKGRKESMEGEKERREKEKEKGKKGKKMEDTVNGSIIGSTIGSRIGSTMNSPIPTDDLSAVITRPRGSALQVSQYVNPLFDGAEQEGSDIEVEHTMESEDDQSRYTTFALTIDAASGMNPFDPTHHRRSNSKQYTLTPIRLAEMQVAALSQTPTAPVSRYQSAQNSTEVSRMEAEYDSDQGHSLRVDPSTLQQQQQSSAGGVAETNHSRAASQRHSEVEYEVDGSHQPPSSNPLSRATSRSPSPSRTAKDPAELPPPDSQDSSKAVASVERSVPANVMIFPFYTRPVPVLPQPLVAIATERANGESAIVNEKEDETIRSHSRSASNLGSLSVLPPRPTSRSLPPSTSTSNSSSSSSSSTKPIYVSQTPTPPPTPTPTPPPLKMNLIERDLSPPKRKLSDALIVNTEESERQSSTTERPPAASSSSSSSSSNTNPAFVRPSSLSVLPSMLHISTLSRLVRPVSSLHTIPASPLSTATSDASSLSSSSPPPLAFSLSSNSFGEGMTLGLK